MSSVAKILGVGFLGLGVTSAYGYFVAYRMAAGGVPVPRFRLVVVLAVIAIAAIVFVIPGAGRGRSGAVGRSFLPSLAPVVHRLSIPHILPTKTTTRHRPHVLPHRRVPSHRLRHTRRVIVRHVARPTLVRHTSSSPRLVRRAPSPVAFVPSRAPTSSRRASVSAYVAPSCYPGLLGC